MSREETESGNFDWHDNWEDEDEEDGDGKKDGEELEVEEEDTFAARSSTLTSNVEMMIKNVEDLDIMKLDVKVSKLKTHKVEDVDFFADMKPDIPKAASALEQFEEKLKIVESPKKHSLLVTIFVIHFIMNRNTREVTKSERSCLFRFLNPPCARTTREPGGRLALTGTRTILCDLSLFMFLLIFHIPRISAFTKYT